MSRSTLILIAAGAFAIGALLSTTAAAQINLGVGVPDVRVGVSVGDPYSYRGYDSGRWYPYDEPRRSGRWYADYDGYDCYRAFQYAWYDGYRARYESTWCFDDRGRDYEVRRTRVVVRID